MKDQLRLLFQLNQLDLKIHELEETLEKIPVRRSEGERNLAEKKNLLEEKTKNLSELEKSKRDKEGEVEFTTARLKEFEGKLSAIKTNKEYQAALKEMAETKKNNKAIEDQILEAMTQIEALKGESQKVEEELKSMTAAFEKESQELAAEEERDRKEAQEIEQEKQKIVLQIESGILNKYQRVKKIRREAVTFVESGTCQGCHMHIPPQLYIEVQKTKEVHTCPTCHRILFLQEWQKEEVNQEGAL